MLCQPFLHRTPIPLEEWLVIGPEPHPPRRGTLVQARGTLGITCGMVDVTTVKWAGHRAPMNWIPRILRQAESGSLKGGDSRKDED